MIRADNIVCGTSTTGTGSLTLAATPEPPGGVDFDVFLRATGIGFGNSAAAIVVSYTIIEYTDTTFAKAKQTEKGVGTIALGAGAGIANVTLARTLLQTTATSLDSQPATQNIAPGTGISIVTAANTLVFISPSAEDVLGFSPFIDVTTHNNGSFPLRCCATLNNAITMPTGTELFTYFTWATPMLVKRAVMVTIGSYTGGTSNLYGRIYAISSGSGVNQAGRPGKLLIDFGVLGTANSSFASANTLVQSAAATNGFLLMPGSYVYSCLAIFTGGSGTPTVSGDSGMVLAGNQGYDGAAINFSGPSPYTTATGGNATAPDPANITGYALAGNNYTPSFAFKSS